MLTSCCSVQIAKQNLCNQVLVVERAVSLVLPGGREKQDEEKRKLKKLTARRSGHYFEASAGIIDSTFTNNSQNRSYSQKN